MITSLPDTLDLDAIELFAFTEAAKNYYGVKTYYLSFEFGLGSWLIIGHPKPGQPSSWSVGDIKRMVALWKSGHRWNP